MQAAPQHANVPPSSLKSLKSLDAVDREFLPAALELLETPPSPIRIAALWFICLAFVTGLALSFFGKLDIHAVAQGRIQPSGRSKIVQPLEPGKIVSMAVENGSRVAAGDVLLELDPTDSGADREAQVLDLEAAQAEGARRRMAVQFARNNVKPLPSIDYPANIRDGVRQREDGVLHSDVAQLASNIASLKAQIDERTATRNRLNSSVKARDRLLALTQERVDMRTTVSDQGSLSRALVIESMQQHELQMITQATERGQLVETEASLKTIERKLEEVASQFIADQTQKLAEAERKADRIAQELIKAKSKNERTTIRAPISGSVQQLAVTTVGQVVTTGQSLLTIVPTDAPIEVEVMVLNSDIGFVEIGQKAVIKVEAFPFTRYGTLDGTIEKISREAIEDREANALADPNSSVKPQSSQLASPRTQSLVFPAIIGLGRRTINIDGKEIPLSAGMAVTVEILTGQRRAIDYVLSPLREVTSRSAHER